MASVVNVDDCPGLVFEEELPFELSDEHFFSVEKSMLQADQARDFDLYIKRNAQYVLFKTKEIPLSEKERNVSERLGSQIFYILQSERGKFLQFLEDSMMDLLVDDSIPISERATALYDMGAEVVSELFYNPESKKNIVRSKRLVDGISTFIGHDPSSLHAIFANLRMEPYEVTHCINSAVFGIGLGNRLGISNSKDINTLGLASLLHDVGKQAIPENIRNKPGKLSDNEWLIMKRHSEMGEQMIRRSGSVPEEAILPIVQHHEKIDGSGYPMGLKGDDIHLFSKIVGGVDIFDALTTKRSYADEMDAFSALRLMKDEYDGKIDPFVFRELVLLLQS